MAGEKTLARSEYTFAVNASPGNELADSVRCQAWNSRLRSDVLGERGERRSLRAQLNALLFVRIVV